MIKYNLQQRFLRRTYRRLFRYARLRFYSNRPDEFSFNSRQSIEQIMETNINAVADKIEFPSDITRDTANKDTDAIDPANTSVFLFPGQGSQFVGMGAALVDCEDSLNLYKTASDILGYNLLDLCLTGKKEELDKTVNCQPAVFVTSLAAVQKLKVTNPMAIESCIAAAGFSIGELTALVFAGAMSFADGVRLVKSRAAAMQHASHRVPSAMMTVFLTPAHRLGLACATAREYCKTKEGGEVEFPVCTVANYLYPECKVIAGHTQALDFIAKHASDFGIRRSHYLPVSGAFHTTLMKPATAAFAGALE